MVDDYYTSQKARFMREFDRSAREVQPFGIARYGEQFTETLTRQARQEFEAMLTRLPYIGGRQNPLTYNLYTSAQALAFFKVAQAHGIPAEAVGEMLYLATERQLARVPRFVTRLLGRFRFTRPSLRQMRKRAAASQERRYPGDWVFTFLEGDGVEFDWGVDYTECGICKLFQAEGGVEFTPYLCPLDYPMSDAFGWGMVRTKTLGQGDEKCDFRFKRGRATPHGWPPPFLKATDKR